MKATKLVLGVGILAVLTPIIAKAQFQGDVFFARPSVAVEEGSSGTLEVQVFSGADVVGASQIDVLFDPAQLKVLQIDPSTAPELAGGLATAPLGAGFGIVDLNSVSLQQPFGTVSLARLEVQPLVPAGSTIAVTIQVHSLLRQDSSAFALTQGFSGEVVVVSAGAQTSNAPSSVVRASGFDRLGQRARAFRRPGLTVDLFDLDSRNGTTSATLRRVVVPDGSAAAERPKP